MKLNPSGLCACGCGENAPLARSTDTARGYVKGEPMRFVMNHHLTGPRWTEDEKRRMSETRTGKLVGEKNPAWKGGKTREFRRVGIRVGKDHPMADRNGLVLEHRLVMAGSLGRYLRSDEIVHHINEDPFDNRPENLVLCDRAQHIAIHALIKAGIGQVEAVDILLRRRA